MSIKDLFSVIVGKNKEETSLEMLDGRTIGVDDSIILMKWLTSASYLGPYQLMDPKVNFDALIGKMWSDLYTPFCLHDITIILVLDGARNYAKKRTICNVR